MVENNNNDSRSVSFTSSSNSTYSRKEIGKEIKENREEFKQKSNEQEKIEQARKKIEKILGKDALKNLGHFLFVKNNIEASKLVGIINKSDDKDLFIAYDGLRKILNSEEIIGAKSINDELSKLIEEAKKERTFNVEKARVIAKRIKSGEKVSEVLKDEWGKIDKAGKALMVPIAGVLATLFAAGAAIIAPIVGVSYGVKKGAEGIAGAAKKGKDAIDKRTEEKRQKLADTKKDLVDFNTGEKDLLAKYLIDLSVSEKKLKILEVAMKQNPDLKDLLNGEFKSIKEYIIAKSDKLEKQKEFNDVLNNLNEEKAKKLIDLINDIKSQEETGYFKSLKNLVAYNFVTHIKSIFSNKITTKNTDANKAFFRNIEQDESKQKFGLVEKFVDIYSKLHKENKEEFRKMFSEDANKRNDDLTSTFITPELDDVRKKIIKENITLSSLDDKDPKPEKVKELADNFNKLDISDMKNLIETGEGLLKVQAQEKPHTQKSNVELEELNNQKGHGTP
ncbi:hypothetical protein [Wolbachia endosymbiont of Pentidionis agamae]|uniref:hypothetical protein n=1 Tax=Wolbachia endosymbiont of Pentidionis agamae TaxID=3110435 RepID=UPI002FD37CB9